MGEGEGVKLLGMEEGLGVRSMLGYGGREGGGWAG